MTTLLCQQLGSSLSQEVRFNPTERFHIGAITPYIYLHNAPSGTFTITMSGINGVVFSKSFTSSDIKLSLNTTDNYCHVFYPIIPDYPCQIESGLFTIELTASGYTPSYSSFIGWCQQFDNNQNEADYIVTGDGSLPLAIRFKGYKEGIRCR